VFLKAVLKIGAGKNRLRFSLTGC